MEGPSRTDANRKGQAHPADRQSLQDQMATIGHWKNGVMERGIPILGQPGVHEADRPRQSRRRSRGEMVFNLVAILVFARRFWPSPNTLENQCPIPTEHRLSDRSLHQPASCPQWKQLQLSESRLPSPVPLGLHRSADPVGHRSTWRPRHVSPRLLCLAPTRKRQLCPVPGLHEPCGAGVWHGLQGAQERGQVQDREVPGGAARRHGHRGVRSQAGHAKEGEEGHAEANVVQVNANSDASRGLPSFRSSRGSTSLYQGFNAIFPSSLQPCSGLRYDPTILAKPEASWRSCPGAACARGFLAVT